MSGQTFRRIPASRFEEAAPAIWLSNQDESDVKSLFFLFSFSRKKGAFVFQSAAFYWLKVMHRTYTLNLAPHNLLYFKKLRNNSDTLILRQR